MEQGTRGLRARVSPLAVGVGVGVTVLEYLHPGGAVPAMRSAWAARKPTRLGCCSTG
jgi:hypothetical protein